jgi:hypothetical protein
MPFFLMLVGLLLIIFNIRFIKSDKAPLIKAAKKDKNSFTRVLDNEELDLTAVDIIVGELRMEFSETILELQKEIVELSNRVEGLAYEKEKEKETSKVKIEESYKLPNIQKEVIPESEALSRTSEIGELLKQGFSVEEISEKFQMGRGEILLIKKLYQK